MGRAVLALALFALAAQAQDTASGTCVVKEEGMRMARKRLRYRGRLQQAEKLQLVLWQEIRREFDAGSAPQSQRGPEVTLDLEITTDRFENGVTYFTMRVTEAGAAGGTANAEQLATLNRCVVALKGLSGQGALAQDGSGLELRWAGLDKLSVESRGLAEQAHVSLASMVVPVPAAPMGEGGRWVMPVPGEKRPGEPKIEEVGFSCSVIGRGATISVSAGAEDAQRVEMPPQPGAPALVRTKTHLMMNRRLRLLPGRLFPAGEATTTIAAHYTAGDATFVDRQLNEVRLRGPAEPRPRRITVVGVGEDPKVPIEIAGTMAPGRYAIEYVERETGPDGKRVQPRVRVVGQCAEWPELDPLASINYLVAWAVEDVSVVADPENPAPLGFEDTLRGLRGLEGSGAYGRSCDAILQAEFLGPGMVTKRPQLAPQMWLELPDGRGPDFERCAERLCEAIEWSMLPVPEPTYRGLERRALEMGKGGTWRHEDEVAVEGTTRPLARVVEYVVAEVGEDFFVVTARSTDGDAPLGPAKLDTLVEGKAKLVACTSKRTGSWTIAKDGTMPRKANTEDVLDREYEIAGPLGDAERIRFHTVRSVTIEALD